MNEQNEQTQTGEVISRGRLGWAIRWPCGGESWMPDEKTARRCLASGQMLAACEKVLDAWNCENPNWSVVANECADAISPALPV